MVSFKAVIAACLVAFCAAPLSAHAVPIFGTVTDAGGKAVAGATVVDYFWNLPPQTGTRDVAAHTDATGHFDMDVASSGADYEPLGRLVVCAAGYAVAGRPAAAGEKSFQLLPGTRVRGALHDAAGQPVAGVQVCLVALVASDPTSGAGFAIPDTLRARFSCSTDASGAFVLSGLSAQDQASLKVEDAAFAFEGQRQIAHYMLATTEVRQRLDFAKWIKGYENALLW